MADNITLHKHTIFLLVGLLLAILISGYLVFGSATNAGSAASSNPSLVQPSSAINAPTGDIQDVYLKATSSGYDKHQITVKKGVPVRLHFTAQNAGCGSSLVIYGLNVYAVSRNGQEAVVDFTPQREGTYQYSCAMRMFPPGNFVVTA